MPTSELGKASNCASRLVVGRPIRRKEEEEEEEPPLRKRERERGRLEEKSGQVTTDGGGRREEDEEEQNFSFLLLPLPLRNFQRKELQERERRDDGNL